MTLHDPKNEGCKGVNSALSRTNRLVPVSSYPAATLSVGFFLVTCYVLFKDVYDGATVTTDHVMTLAVLIGTIASGHMVWSQLQQWRVLPALGLALLFIAGTIYCVTASAGRNALAAIEKGLDAHKTNDDRARVERDLKQAKQRLELALEAEAQECATGEGKRCKARRATRQERETHASVLEIQLRNMEPEQPENADIKHTAKVFSQLPWVTSKPEEIEASLVLFLPFFKAAFAEIATILFASIGFGHRKQFPILPPLETVERKPKETVAPRKPFPSRPALGFLPGNSPGSGKPLPKGEALNDLLTVLAVNGCPSQETLRDRWGVKSKGTVSKWLKDWEAQGHIRRSQAGRRKEISAS